MGMVMHHIKYKQIHGHNETVMMDRSEHNKLHKRLRREGKCNIPPRELARISQSSYVSVYNQKHMKKINFSEQVCKGCYHMEQIRYNIKTGNVDVWCGFDIRYWSKMKC